MTDIMNKDAIREIFSEVSGDLHLHEPLNDYIEPIIKARKHLNHLESLLRMRDMKSAREEAVLLKGQCWELIDYCEDK